ncbi:MAG TPA: type IV secretion system DNA-binding domain-containing protein [Candidatus Binataceae bacterium]|nr:type IV secretion system DNA-binding domain-containing protein [Candidatus Binataceae bacterium]
MWSGGRQAASWQAYATGARMNARFVMVWLKLGLFSWIITTFCLIWYWTGRYFPDFGHQQFVPWFLAWLLGKLSPPFIHPTLPYMGRRYPADVLAAFLNDRHFYQHSFGEWVIHYLRYGAVAPMLITVASVILLRRKSSDAHHLRGLQLITSKELSGAVKNAATRGLLRVPVVRQLSGGKTPGIRIASVTIPADLEPQHFAITGKTGSGKSNCIRQILRQIEARAGIGIVLDPDAEYVSEFYRPERGDLILNPLDERCPSWSPWAELRPESFRMDAEALAQSLIPDAPNSFSQSGADRFFRRSGRTTLVSILETAKPRTAKTITEMLTLPRDRLKKALAGTQAEALIDPGAHDQGAGIVAMATNATNPLSYLPPELPNHANWSAVEWAKNRRGWLFMTSTEDSRAAALPLQNVWLDCLVRQLLTTDLSATTNQVWIIIDELGALDYQGQLENLVVRGRKRGLCVVVGFQAVSQLHSIYGRDRTVTLLSAPATKLILRSDEAETAEWASRTLGQREVVRLQMTTLTGPSLFRDGFNLQPHQTLERVVLPAEIQKLPPLEGYLCIAGYDRARIALQWAEPKKNAPAFVLRKDSEVPFSEEKAGTHPESSPKPASSQGEWD